jgi:hypothetical protein
VAGQERHSKTLILVPHGVKWLANSAMDGATGRTRPDKYKLLTYGDPAASLGSKPPIAHAPDHEWKDPMEGLDAFASVGCRRCGKREWMGQDHGCPGLALIVDGVPVPEGLDHLARRIYEATDEFYRELWPDQYDPGRISLQAARDLAEWACSDDLLYDDEGEPMGGLGTLLEW